MADWLRTLTDVNPEQSVEEVQQHLAHLIEGFDVGEERDAILGRLAALVSGQFAAAIDEGDAAQNRRLLTAGLRAFIARRTLEGPVILIGESLQWSDPSSLEAIQDLLRWSEPWPVLVILIARPGERVTPYLDGLVHIELKELSTDNQVRLLQTRLGASRGVEQVCADLIPRIGGNPFFLLEMVDALLERGVLELRETGKNVLELAPVEGSVIGAQSLPSTLEQLVADRLEELPRGEQAIVDWLAVAGGPLRIDVLRSLVGAQVDEGITRLCARGVCSDGGDSVDVRHPVTRDVAYSSLDVETRVEHAPTSRRTIEPHTPGKGPYCSNRCTPFGSGSLASGSRGPLFGGRPDRAFKLSSALGQTLFPTRRSDTAQERCSLFRGFRGPRGYMPSSRFAT